MLIHKQEDMQTKHTTIPKAPIIVKEGKCCK